MRESVTEVYERTSLNRLWERKSIRKTNKTVENEMRRKATLGWGTRTICVSVVEM